MTEEFTLAMESGQLQLRGAEPFALESPTTISGTNTDGTLSGVHLATPTVTTTRAVPEYGTTATITAAFSMLEPGVGSVSKDGSMSVRVRLAVDLHIVVPLLEGASDCRAAPVDLTLTSREPYDLDTQRVTLRAPNFTVPPIVASPACDGLLVDPVNEALAGAGHSLALTLVGAITPPPQGEGTATTLAVSPTGRARFGDDMTLTATVVPDPEVPGAPPISGVVTFLDEDTSIGTAEVGEDGIATLVTADLQAGSRRLQAVYGGAPPAWAPSSSAVVPYTVTADPFVSTNAAGEIRVGGSKDFDVTVVNTGFGAEIEEARLEVAIAREVGTAPIGPNGATPRLTLDRVVDGAPTAVPLTFRTSPSPPSLNGTIGDPDTWLLDPAEEHTEHLRLEVATGTAVGPLALTFTLVTGEGEDRTVLGSSIGVITMVDEARQVTTITAGLRNPLFPQLNFPPVTPTVRQGNVAEFRNLAIGPVASAGVFPTGTWSFTIDGVPVLGQSLQPGGAGSFTWLDAAPVSSGGNIILIKVPTTIPTGTRQVTVRYSGDGLHAPSQASFPITVEPSIGTIYECVTAAGVGSAQSRFTVNVEIQATLPAVGAAGQDLPVDRVQVRLRLSRTSSHADNFSAVLNPAAQRDLRLVLDPGGVITPATVTQSNNTAWGVNDLNPPDRTIDLAAGTGTITVPSTPGEPAAYTLDRIVLTGRAGSISTSGFTCTPDGTPHTVGTITPAGVVLTAEPGHVVAEGHDVALTATALPVAPGVVEFRDGTTTIGVVPVDATGVARMTTDDLPVGTRGLTARFFGGLVATSPSVPVVLRVATCGDASEPGNGAVVRLVYLELLGRCPDAAGYDYWVERLDGGTSPEVFARSIALTSEAVGRVVDDAYRAMLGRPADEAGRAFWTGRLQASGRYDQLLADLAASGEFWSRAGSSNSGVVTRIYEQLLDRAPDQGGLDHWVGRLDGGVSRRALVLALANLAEPLRVLVDDAYDEILDRAPSTAERTDGITFLRSTGDRSGLYARLIGTQELHDRAQGLPDLA